jgi:tRNA wybutosine-synthesizing protein 3
MVGIRSMGLALESVIGFESGGKQLCMVPEYQLRNLVRISNDRFKENTKRIERFRSLVQEMSSIGPEERDKHGEKWEDAEVRRQKKKAEGLKKAQMKQTAHQEADLPEEDLDISFLEQDT